MKTQINTLVNGSATQVGTPQAIRMELIEKVRKENPNGMTINLKGFDIELKAHHSVSGKSTLYSGEIPLELFIELVGKGALPRKNPKAFISVTPSLSVNLFTNSRRSTYTYNVDNKLITIL